MKDCIIWDIDGTLANCEHRLHHITTPGKKKDWDTFFSLCRHDTPIPHMLRLYDELLVEPVFVTGRRFETFDDTFDWLREHIDDTITRDRLYIRAAGDRRDDDIIKIELLAEVRAAGWNPIMVFDDRTRVVNAWRAAGVPCAQVAPGDF